MQPNPRLTVTVPAHGVRLLRMWPHAPPPPRPPPPPGPPPPHPPCPAGFTAHAAGYWHNLDLRTKASTVAACAAECGPGCAAFEVFVGSGYPGAVRAAQGRLSGIRVSHRKSILYGTFVHMYGCAGRFTAGSGGSRPGQCYVFPRNMTLPFTASASVTCIKD